MYYAGLYCSGWVKRGPLGVIATTMNDAFETGKLIVADLKNGTLPLPSTPNAEHSCVPALLKDRGIVPGSRLDFE